ncbi:hypothetical protein PVK06_038179 [Gossypium arboreum]|uniref:Fe2OG dioxygenase domain-containing protein n=1 Tax=Gossypium arboreum TaxID=29729 RepID=A0ABR0MZL5_GOSAR|nr:hypothetical protein PVK06_038179 [Gossypium arboreum]
MKPLLTDLVSTVSSIPQNFIRPESDRPNVDEVTFDHSIPLVDLQHFDDGPNRSTVVRAIGDACRNYGFFQVKNHGVSKEVIGKMLHVSKQFFHLPESERLKNYSDDPMKTTRLSTSFNVRTENVSSWRDYLRLHCYPLEDYVHEWPTNPPSFREDTSEYCKITRRLAVRLLEAISESLDLERDYINSALGKHAQHMAINYYPPCPEPELTYGLPVHADPNAITILLQDEVPGLQVLKDGKWIAVNPIPYTFIVNIGDQIQVLSNDSYKSVLHRAVVNCKEERISIPTFYCPSTDAVMGPAPKLIDPLHHPPLYRNSSYSEYYHSFWKRGLNSETCLDMFKI